MYNFIKRDKKNMIFYTYNSLTKEIIYNSLYTFVQYFIHKL